MIGAIALGMTPRSVRTDQDSANYAFFYHAVITEADASCSSYHYVQGQMRVRGRGIPGNGCTMSNEIMPGNCHRFENFQTAHRKTFDFNKRPLE